MNSSSSLARWCAMAGIVGIVLGIVAGILGLIDPASVYAPLTTVYNYASSLGKVVAVLDGIAVLGFTASFIGYHLIGAAGDGPLSKIATGLSAIGNAGTALAFFHAAMIGDASPLLSIGYLLLPGWLLLTVAALRAKRVSTIQALWPLGILIVLTAIEIAIPISGVSVIIHQAAYGSLSFVVLNNLAKAPARVATSAV